MFNTEKLSRYKALEVDKVWAKLTRLDRAGEYIFLVNPSVLTWSMATSISTLSPIGTALPSVRVQSQTKTFSLPIYLGSPSNTVDMSDELAAIEALAKLKDDGSLPSMRFQFGDWVEEYCHISNMVMSMKMMRSGKPTLVEGVLTILPCVAFQKPTIAKEVGVVKPTPMTAREAEKVAETIRIYTKQGYSGVRVNGDIIEGLDPKTKKVVKLTDVNSIIRIGLGSNFAKGK
jgi:hypothetical protein